MGETKSGEQYSFKIDTYKYNGITYLPGLTEKNTLKKIEETYFNEEDIFIATYPKSGLYNSHTIKFREY